MANDPSISVGCHIPIPPLDYTSSQKSCGKKGICESVCVFFFFFSGSKLLGYSPHPRYANLTDSDAAIGDGGRERPTSLLQVLDSMSIGPPFRVIPERMQ